MIFPPIVERELRVAARRTATYRVRAGAALLLLGVWTVLVLGAAAERRLPSGPVLLGFLGWPALLCSMLAGVLLTADCLSEELREGTLGLLFLTDLRGRDVVFGKLVAQGVNALFALLAGFPILSLVLLVGGVSPGEFFRTVVVCAVTLLSSLGVGMGVSAFPRPGRQPMVRAFGLLCLLAAVGPTLHGLIGWMRPGFRAEWLLLPSPCHAYACAADARYLFPGGRHAYFGTVGTLLLLGAAGALAAIWRLPRIWREGAPSAAGGRARNWFRRRAVPATWQPQRVLWAGENPCNWLADRERFARRTALWIVALLAPCFLGLLVFSVLRRNSPQTLVAACATALAGHCLIKFLVAAEAGRRLHQDRRSGVLELLLGTTLTEREVLAGLWHGLTRQFLVPGALLAAANLLLSGAVVVWAGHYGMRRGGVVEVFLAAFLGGILMLPLDFLALGWLGMWLGLVQARLGRAIFQTVACVSLSVWGATFLVGYLQGGDVSENQLIYWVLAWFAGSGGLSLVLAWWARRRLLRGFRKLALESSVPRP